MGIWLKRYKWGQAFLQIILSLVPNPWPRGTPLSTHPSAAWNHWPPWQRPPWGRPFIYSSTSWSRWNRSQVVWDFVFSLKYKHSRHIQYALSRKYPRQESAGWYATAWISFYFQETPEVEESWLLPTDLRGNCAWSQLWDTFPDPDTPLRTAKCKNLFYSNFYMILDRAEEITSSHISELLYFPIY